MLEDEYRRMQRGIGRLPCMESVWAAASSKPFYRQWAVTVATKRAVPASVSGTNEVQKLMRRVAQLEAQRDGGDPANKGPGNKTGKQPFIPEEKVKEWKTANPGLCFRFHLKGSCPATAAECKLGSH